MKAGWKTRKLHDVVDLRPSKSEARAKLRPNDAVSFVPMEHLGIGSKTISSHDSRPMEQVVGSYTYFANGDILLAKITPCFENGKLGIASGLVNGVGFGSSEFMVLRPHGEVLSDWLYYFLSRDEFRAEGERCMTGAVGHKRVPPGYVEGTSIPVPSLPEQRRIVGILDAAFEGMATARANAEKNVESAREVFESQREATLAPRAGWKIAPLGDLCEIKHGFAFKGEFFRDSGDFVLLTPGNFFERGGYRDRGDKQKFYVGEIPLGYVLKRGAMLLAMTEQAAGLLGSPLLVPEANKFLHNQRLGLVVPRTGQPWAAEFFFHVFNLARVRREIHEGGTGAKVRHTSPGRIQAVQVAYPDNVRGQRVVAEKLVEVGDLAERLEAIYQQKLAALDELKKSLLHRAFSGQL